MKNKYQRLSKEEKKECQKMYFQTKKGKEMRLRLIRLTITGVVGILFSIYILGTGISSQEIKWYDYLVAITLFASSIVFLFGALSVRGKVLNQFALQIPRFKNK